MSYPMYEIGDKAEALADDANSLLDSTLNIVGRRCDDARDALETVLNRGKSIYGVALNHAAKDTKIVNRVIHANLYQTIAIGIGIGVFFGYFLSRQHD